MPAWFMEGGWWMWPLAALAVLILLGSGLSVVAMQRMQWNSQARYLFALLPALVGLVAAVIAAAGYTLSMNTVSQAVALVDPGQREALLAQGKAECLNIIYFGAGVAMLGLLETTALMALAAAKGSRRKRETPS